METVERHDKEANHGNRAIVQRGLAIGQLVVGRKRIAVEPGLRRLRPADVGIRLIRDRIQLRRGPQQPRELEQAAVGRLKQELARARKATRVRRLCHGDFGGEPAER